MSKRDRRRLTAASWVQATRLGVDSLVDANTLRAWVTDLATGAPLSGATATLGADSAVSGEDGTCALPLSGLPEPVLAVQLERDLAVLPSDGWRAAGNAATSPSARPGSCSTIAGSTAPASRCA